MVKQLSITNIPSEKIVHISTHSPLTFQQTHSPALQPGYRGARTVGLLEAVKCKGLNGAGRRGSVAALRPPGYRGRLTNSEDPMARGMAQLNTAIRVRVPASTAKPSSQ